MEHSYILTASCPDGTGITAAVSGFIAGHGGWILDSSQHSDACSGQFFMRVQIKADSLPFDVEGFAQRFLAVAENFGMQWQVNDSALRKRVVILVSRHDHCLVDLLHRWRNQDFAFDIPCIISNHEDLRSYVEWHDIPFHHVPIESQNRDEGFQRIADIFDSVSGEVMVMARYMQILPADLCDRYKGQIINIHHGFLPSFAGARPYQQAFDYGVKLVGATSHYATGELDAGPIIDQNVVRVDHSVSVEEMIRCGKDVERGVLARALRLHVEDRVLLHGRRTIVFD